MQSLFSLLKTRVELSAIFYDLDGTMAHTDPIHFIAWQEYLRKFGIEIDETFYKQRMSGKLNPAIVTDLLPQLSAEAGDQLANDKEARFRELAQQLPPMPGLLKLIDWASQRQLKQAVVSNAPRENAYFMLNALKLESSFDRVILADDLGIGKPDPAPYTHALQEFGLQPHQAIAFEDSPSGIRSAVAAGIFTIGVTSTQSAAELKNLGANLTIGDFTDANLWALLNDVLPTPV